MLTLPPGSLLVLLRLPPPSLLLRPTRPSKLLPRAPLSDTGLFRHSSARDLSLKEVHRLLAVADVAASNEDDRRCRRRRDMLLLLPPECLPLLLGLCAMSDSRLLVVCRRDRSTGCVDGRCSLELLLVVRIARARMMCG
jgi:hypothetical protein